MTAPEPQSLPGIVTPFLCPRTGGSSFATSESGLPNLPLQLTIAGGRPLRGLPLALAAEWRYVGRTLHPRTTPRYGNNMCVSPAGSFLAIASLLSVACASTPGGSGGAGGATDTSSAGNSTSGSPTSTGTAVAVNDWSNWTCTEVGTTYCYAEFQQTYFIKCYPTTGGPCYFGSDVLGDGSSCPGNTSQGCESCKVAFDDFVLDWITQ